MAIRIEYLVKCVNKMENTCCFVSTKQHWFSLPSSLFHVWTQLNLVICYVFHLAFECCIASDATRCGVALNCLVVKTSHNLKISIFSILHLKWIILHVLRLFLSRFPVPFQAFWFYLQLDRLCVVVGWHRKVLWDYFSYTLFTSLCC